jgi:peroxiredoxin
LAELRGLLKSEETALFAVSVDTPVKSAELIKKIEKDGKGAVNFLLLSDPDHKTIDAYGLFDPAYAGRGAEGIPHPAVFVLDKTRKIVWAKVESDYRKRPTNEEIRAALDKLK